ncbi:MAG: ribonuclease Z [Candidatus Helarchaeota archaeon]
MKVYFLGTAGTVPTKNRNLIGIAIKREGKIFLFDPGENSQKQMIRLKLSFLKVHSIFITHLHGDHIMGIPGILMSSDLLNRTNDLLIFGPPGTKKFITSILDSIILNIGFDIIIKEVNTKGIIYEDKEFFIKAGLAEHNCFCLYYIFEEKPRRGKFDRQKAVDLGVPIGPLWKKLQNGEDITLKDGRTIRSRDVVGPPRPGRKIVIALDTRPTQDILEASKDADLLIMDGSFSHSLIDKALETKHSTVKESAQLAKNAGVRKLALTHFSSRYTDVSELRDEIKDIFPDAILTEDLMEIQIKYRDKEK